MSLAKKGIPGPQDARFQSLVEQFCDFVWETDAEHRVTLHERRAGYVAVLPDAATIGKRRWELPHSAPGEEGWRLHREMLDARQGFRDFQLSRRTTDNVERHFEISGEPVFAADGAFLGYRGVGRDVTERRNAELALRENEARYLSLAELSSDWFWELDPEMRFIRVAGTGLAAIGLSPDLLVGHRASEFVKYELIGITWEAFERLRAERRPYRDVRGRITITDGSYRYLSVSGAPMFDRQGRFTGYRGVTRDITSQALAEHALRESEARVRSLVQLSSDWYWEQDRNFRFRELAAEGLTAAGLPPAAHVGKARWEIAGASASAEDWAAHRALLEAHQPFRDFEYQRRTELGETLWLSTSGEPTFDERGRFTGYRGISRNITARKRIEQGARLLADELERRVARRSQELDASIRELEAFAYSVSEAARGPLQAIGELAAQVARLPAGALPDDARAAIARSHAIAAGLPDLCRGLADFARIGGHAFAPASVDMEALAHRAIAALDVPAATAIHVGALPPATGDPDLLLQAWTQLLANAVKFSSGRAKPLVHVSGRVEGAALLYEVRDNGVGFDSLAADGLFQPFRRLHAPAEFPGAGLGLAIVRRIVERHGGWIDARAMPDAGATLLFRLPAQALHA